MIAPDFKSFAPVYDRGEGQALFMTLPADLETPVSAMLKLGVERRHGFLLESVEGGRSRGRYSVLGFAPDAIWRMDGGSCRINPAALEDPDRFEAAPGGALDNLRGFARAAQMQLPRQLPPMAAGIFGYLSYDAVRLIERLPGAGADVLDLPDGIFLRPSQIAVFDSVEGTVSLVAPVRPAQGLAARQAYDAAAGRLEAMAQKLGAPLPAPPPRPEAAEVKPQSNMKKSAYLEMVRRAKDYILAGDIFQVTLSQRFSSAFALPPFALYRSLRRVNPSPYLFFFNFGGFQLIGSSPEILVRCQGGKVTIRPIAGTFPRGASAGEDGEIARALLADPKERAEHLMLLDLGRNDVGRVSSIGSVKADEQFALQYTSHLIHIVSNVEGRLAPDKDALDALLAGFPAGTVSGAPKVRAMEIIDELEREKRGIYAGAVGYFAANGDMDSCIALRTAIVENGRMHVRAGGGIVADSDPSREYDESENKARALMRAAQDAHLFVR